jgi:hypothetical protein
MRRSWLTCCCEELECISFPRNQVKLLAFVVSFGVVIGGILLGDSPFSFGFWVCVIQSGYYLFISLIQIPSFSTWIPNQEVEEQIKNMLFTFQMVLSTAALILYCSLVIPNTIL